MPFPQNLHSALSEGMVLCAIRFSTVQLLDWFTERFDTLIATLNGIVSREKKSEMTNARPENYICLKSTMQRWHINNLWKDLHFLHFQESKSFRNSNYLRNIKWHLVAILTEDIFWLVDFFPFLENSCQRTRCYYQTFTSKSGEM